MDMYMMPMLNVLALPAGHGRGAVGKDFGLCACPCGAASWMRGRSFLDGMFGSKSFRQCVDSILQSHFSDTNPPGARSDSLSHGHRNIK